MDLQQLEDAIKAAGTSPAEIVKTEVETTEVKTETVEADVETQNSLKAELDKVKNKSPKSEEEKAEYTFINIAKRLQDLGRDPAELLGIKKEEEVGEGDKPITRKEMEEMISKVRQPITKTATELADEIPNETERELAKYYLENVIKSSGNSTEDLNNAKTMVEAVKLKKQLELQSLRPEVKTHSSANSIQVNHAQVNMEFSAEEKMLLDHSKGLLTKDDILNSRKK
tara:strand:+ start:9559 stop:10239 length:681 start_codon:yes stop_codon:yes gene_type:complete